MRTDIFARLDREPEPPKIVAPRMSRHRIALFGGTLAFYLAIVFAVLVTSWLVALDWKVMLFRPYQQWPELHAFLDYYVVLGQRGPTAVMVACWLGWRSWRQHTLRPLLVLGTALLLLNVTVGAVKLGLGRLGPHYATQIGSAEMFAGGDIFPSGHTANAVVTWGILAYLATTPRARRYLSALSATVSLGVGLTTVYIGTHWLSDVLLGWAAGLLILLALPWFEPLIARTESWIFDLREQWRARRRSVRPALAPQDGPQPVLLPQSIAGEGAAFAGTAATPAAPASAAAQMATGVATATATATATGARARAHTPTVCPERPPVAPAGSRRPPQHPDHGSRTTASPARPMTGG
ncbi:phosphatase PAP2 family protein [Streptomyces sp. CAI-155]|uniref:phosphatase PAP2 family protein n=1 Tax=unclassified Streptomyces TaxID=2593676 RepID=UPI001587C088|nr:phosphatase PAP2 family protein [Streptomyces sp. CAI-155]NUV82289.1 phosphatase PAP2 family protein [Streptomyces sp. CAI-155]